ncbi:MAG: DUF4493 domain-containing protein [Parabacteroides distasonis]
MKAMRHIHLYLYLPFFALLATLSACVGEELSAPKGEGTGYLRLTLGDISAAVSAEVETKAGTLTLPDTYIPAKTDFMIDIKQGGTSYEGYPKLFSEIEGQTLELPTSIYTLEVYAGTNELIQENPYFYGSKEVRIVPGENLAESIETSLANTMLVAAVSENLRKHYKTWQLTVKVGEDSDVLATHEVSEGTLFVRSGQMVKVRFEGTNLLDKQTTPKEWDQNDQAEARKQYIVQCDPDLSIFSNIQMQALATPTYEGDLLTGSKITLGCVAEGVPIELVDTWTISALYNDTPIRTYSGNNLTGAMTVVEGWPYVPKGCKLSTSIRLRTGEEFTLLPVDVAVTEPDFSVSVSGRTSYSVYAEENNPTAANAMDGSSIVDIVATASIAEGILNNPNYSDLLKSSYKTDAGNVSGELAYGVVTSLTSLAWQKHALTATVTFDGTEKVSMPIDCHVTGLPYKPEMMVADDWNRSGNCSYDNGVLQLGGGTGDASATSKMLFHIPNSIEVVLNTNVTVCDRRIVGIWCQTTFTASIDGSTLISQSGNKEEKNYSLSGNATFSKEGNVIVLNSSYKTAGPWSKVYTLHMLYR